jgi:UDP-N-acetylmuramoyl-L-alanyl-D-glutamate--2,6-diaminopimelate ligase
MEDLENFEKIIAENNITSVTSDSGKVTPGSCFVAIKGFSVDGNDYIEEAIDKGSKLIITDSVTSANSISAKFIFVKNARKALALLCTALYKDSPKYLFAVTGTNGKSSVIHFIGSFLDLLGRKAVTIGTLGEKYYGLHKKSDSNESLTTFSAEEFNKNLKKYHDDKIDYCALEASSIGLDQHRIYGRKFCSSAFTSFSQDHLDYHGNMENYLKAKLMLFKDYTLHNTINIINSDIKEFDIIKNFLQENKKQFITIGLDGDLKYRIKNLGVNGQDITLEYKNKTYNTNTTILGKFQVSNILTAALMLTASAINLEKLIELIPKLSAPEGRLERVVHNGISTNIFIDFAHTPDALESVLRELKESKDAESKLYVVFGCGGDRDKTKRPTMAAISEKYADFSIITDDNPRTETPSSIRKDIIKNMKNFIEIDGRKNAIEYAINNSSEKDIIVIAGKGHENYQIIGKQKFHFSDKECALAALAKK